MNYLRRIVEQTDTPAGIAFDVFVQTLVVLSVVAYSIETLPGISPDLAAALRIFELLTVGVFTMEYCLRLLVAKPRSKYVFSFFGIVDLVAILPFYLSLGFDLRAVRAFRLLRIVRLLKLARYNSAIRRFHIALSIAKEEIVLFACVTLILLYLAAIGIHHFESEAQQETFGSVFHCLWWAVATLTTVGYGDVYPVTVGGKIFTFVMLMVSLGFISVPTGLVASALAKARQIEEQETKQQEVPDQSGKTQ
ncbi:ion transporter [Pirellulaceae bacterium SH449]